MKHNLITTRLNVSILNLENTGGFERTQLVKKSAKSFSHNYKWVETKPVNHSSIYLYPLPPVNDKKPNFSICFNYLEEHSYFKKLPIEEQTVEFGYCLDVNSEHKEVFLSKKFHIKEAKEIIKLFTNELKNNKLTADYMIALIEKHAFKYSNPKDELKFQSIENELQEPINSIHSCIKKIEISDEELKKTKEKYLRSVAASKEHKEVLKLEKELEEAIKKLSKLKTDKYNYFQYDKKVKENRELKSQIIKKGLDFKKQTLEKFKSNELSFNYIDSFSKYFDLSKYL